MIRVLIASVAVALLLVPAGAQEQRPFRASVRTVPIFATVADATGRLVPDLEQQDFQVLDNGKPTEITLFDKTMQPLSVVIAIDTSASMTLVLDFVKLAAETFILRLLPEDRAMVLSFADRVQVSGHFTSDRDSLLRFLRADMRFGMGTRLWDALYQGTAHLQKETARKAVLVLSDGENTTSDVDGEAVLSRAHDADVMVYAVGMRNRYRAGPTGPLVQTRPDAFLRKLTAQTGGGYFEISTSTELNRTFTRVAAELHSQYLLGITPAAADGKTRKLQVRVTRPGMTVRARQAYVSPID